jgi:hypothetical protein
MRSLLFSIIPACVFAATVPALASGYTPEHQYTLIARAGEVSTPEAPFTKIHHAFFVGEKIGIIASTTPNAGPGSPKGFWFLAPDGSLTKVIAPGDPLPGDPARTVVSASAGVAVGSQEIGLVLQFTPSLSASNPTDFDQVVVRFLPSGEAQPLLWEGLFGPGTTLRVRFPGLVLGRSTGMIISGVLNTTPASIAHWRISEPNEPGTLLKLIARTGMPAPEFGTGAVFTDGAAGVYPVQTSPCDAVFIRDVSGVGLVVFRQTGNEREVLVARGDPAPPPMTGTLGRISPRDGSADGSLVIYSYTDANDGFAWRLHPDSSAEYLVGRGDGILAPEGHSVVGAVERLYDFGLIMSDNGGSMARVDIEGSDGPRLISESTDGSFRLVFDPSVPVPGAPGAVVEPPLPGITEQYTRNNAGDVLMRSDTYRTLVFHPRHGARHIIEPGMHLLASGEDLGEVEIGDAILDTGDGPFRALMLASMTDGSDALVQITLAPECLADTNGDTVVNFADLNAVLGAYGQSGPSGFSGADINGDGVVNFADLNAVLSAFGASCG